MPHHICPVQLLRVLDQASPLAVELRPEWMQPRGKLAKAAMTGGEVSQSSGLDLVSSLSLVKAQNLAELVATTVS